MEITKQNETFALKATTDVYEINGNIIREESGSLNVHFAINKIDEDYVGEGYYTSYADNSRVNFGVNCAEEIRDEIAAFATTIIDSVLEYFKSNN